MVEQRLPREVVLLEGSQRSERMAGCRRPAFVVDVWLEGVIVDAAACPTVSTVAAAM